MLLASAVLAITVPTLLAYNVSPSATFLNQALSLVGWGVALLVLSVQLPAGPFPGLTPGAAGGSLALFAMLVCALASPLLSGLPWSLALSSAGVLAAALLVLWVGVGLARAGLARSTADAVFAALLLAGLLNLLVSLVQFFAPAWADGNLLAHVTGSRPGGNLRQPNHLSSLLMLAACALAWWTDRAQERWPEARQRRLAIGALLMLGLMFGGALTASRTGGVCALLLAAWGLVDRNASRQTRGLLMAAPVMFGLCWWGLSLWAAANGTAYGGDSQLHSADLSSSRFGIYENTLSLIAHNPWTGVGWGDFNFAWTLTPFPGRPIAFFDHTHNLVLQLVVELGLPIGGALVALLLWVLWKACTAAWAAESPVRGVARCALAMVLVMVVHSQFEYPLWYAYFLLPTVFVLGLVLGCASKVDAVRGTTFRWARAVLLGCSSLLVVLGTASVVDYKLAVDIFVPPPGAASLEDRIALGQRSVFFAHHADYAAVTTAEPPSSQMPGFRRANHYLLDSRLMMAWASALHEVGEEDKARYVAQRLKEFRNQNAEEFFAPCSDPVKAQAAFQCQQPSRPLTFRDFR